MGAYECFMQTEFGGGRSRDQNFTGRILTKVDEFEPICLGNYRYWWKMICVFRAH